MAYPQAIDLHMHSTVSDGTDTPAEILSHARAAGLELFALTDHDAVKGCARIMALRSAEDPAFLTGVEFASRDDKGKYHILGYGFDPTAEPIRRIVELGHSFRMKKLCARLDFLDKAFGFQFPEEEVNALYALDNPGKPHIGNLMVKYGYVPTKETAIKDYINKIRFRSEFIRPEEAIAAILGGGGIPVLAHPCYGDGDQLILGEDMDRRLRRLMDFGLQGVEAFYSGFTEKLNREMLDFAERYGLYVTAGSDYHGTNKLIVLGDTGPGRSGEWPEGLRRFLDDVRRVQR